MARFHLFYACVMSICFTPIAAETLDGFVSVDRLPIPTQPALAIGREIWGANCENCHGGNKLVGAPKITSEEEWAKRIDQGLEVLFGHAIEGFYGPTFKEMPPRGGNPDLTDTQVQSAVAFMVWQSGGVDAVDTWLSE